MGHPIPVIAIFDIGKTNKKLLLFNEQYQIVWEKSARFAETVDEDGFPCESLDRMVASVSESLSEVLSLKDFQVKAVNFSTYGASLVYLNKMGEPLTPLYNYLKPFPDQLVRRFEERYGNIKEVSLACASPWLGSLNAGLQLFRLKEEKSALYANVQMVLHLPQFVSYGLTRVPCSDITSIGCHTLLWDFDKQSYHAWVQSEDLTTRLMPIMPADKPIQVDFKQHALQVGIGLHDSSAALIPYLVTFQEPFILISTGTWSISLNPFSTQPLTETELEHDCLAYLSFQQKPVKASRYAIGFEHDHLVQVISEYFQVEPNALRNLNFNLQWVLDGWQTSFAYPTFQEPIDVFDVNELSQYESADQAYHLLMIALLSKQARQTARIVEDRLPKRIFVDGGFSRNQVFMNLLALYFPGWEVYAASMAQATALGAAMVVHESWNQQPLPADLIALRRFAAY